MKSMITKTIVAMAILTTGVMAQAEDSCHIATADEGQKVACAEAKFNNKVAQLASVAVSIKAELRDLANRKDDDASDAAEREARVQKLNMALTGIAAELKEATDEAKAFLRGVIGRQEDTQNDSAERQARFNILKELAQKIDAKLQRKVAQFEAFIKSVHDSIDKD